MNETTLPIFSSKEYQAVISGVSESAACAFVEQLRLQRMNLALDALRAKELTEYDRGNLRGQINVLEFLITEFGSIVAAIDKSKPQSFVLSQQETQVKLKDEDIQKIIDDSRKAI